MKRWSLLPLLALIVLVCMSGFAQAQSGTIYRGFIWGVSMEDVRTYETAAFMDKVDNSLVFVEQVKGRRALIRYDFSNDKLWRIQYEYVDLHLPSAQAVLDMISDVQAKLGKKFGKPSSETLIWKKNRYRSHPKFFTRAYGSGHVAIETEWQKDATYVRLQSSKGVEYYNLTYTLENRAARQEIQRERMFQFYDSLN